MTVMFGSARGVLRAVLMGGLFASVLHEATGDPGAGSAAGDKGGTPAGAGAAGDKGGTPAGAGAAGDKGGTPAGAGAATGDKGGAKQYTFPEDRSNWVDPKKFSAAEKATKLAAATATRLASENESLQARVRALAGVNPPDPEAAERQDVVEAFIRLFPAARFLTDEKFAEKMEQFMSSAENADQVVNSHWENHREVVYADLASAYMDEIGIAELSDRQQAKLQAAFLASVPNRKADPDGWDAWRRRYEKRDPALIEEFVKEYAEDMIEPVRRQALSGVVRNPRVPQGGPRRPAPAAAKPKINFGNLDEVMQAAQNDPRMSGR